MYHLPPGCQEKPAESGECNISSRYMTFKGVLNTTLLQKMQSRQSSSELQPWLQRMPWIRAPLCLFGHKESFVHGGNGFPHMGKEQTVEYLVCLIHGMGMRNVWCLIYLLRQNTNFLAPHDTGFYCLLAL